MQKVNDDLLKEFVNLRDGISVKSKRFNEIKSLIKDHLMSRGGKSFITKGFISTLKEWSKKGYTVEPSSGYTVKVESKTI